MRGPQLLQALHETTPPPREGSPAGGQTPPLSGGREPAKRAAGGGKLLFLAIATLLLAACGAGGLTTFRSLQGPQGIPALADGPRGALRRLAVATHRAPLPPAELAVLGPDGIPLAPDAWTRRDDLRLAAVLGSPALDARLAAEVELRTADQPFTGEPTHTAAPGAAGQVMVPVAALEPGQRYHWRARAREVDGQAGPWTAYTGTFGYAPAPPPAPQVAPLPNGGVLTQRQVQLEWDADGGPAGVVGFAYALDQAPDGTTPEIVSAQEPAATLGVPADGDWYAHVRTLDRAGNWSAPATVALHVDTVPLQIGGVTSRTSAFHPLYDTAAIGFAVNKPADVTVEILPAGSDTALRAYSLGTQEGDVRLEWDGRDESGAVAPAGAYRFRVRLTDGAGRSAEGVYGQLRVTQKRIVVSLSQQALTAFDGDGVFLSTLVTSGGPDLPTPVGTYHILARYTPFTFKSPWPKGSPYWYPDSPTSYALLFDDEGLFLHDAPWRGRFGPGSNAQRGTPGGDTTGTHGCVNVPLGAQARLFSWAEVGTPVIVTG